MIVPDHPTGRWSVRCLGTWAAGHGGPQILALQTRMAPTATKAVNPLTEKPKRVGTPSPTSPTTAYAATALRRQVADSPHRKATRPLTTLGGEEPVMWRSEVGWLSALAHATIRAPIVDSITWVPGFRPL
jgi:hypothetical protein